MECLGLLLGLRSVVPSESLASQTFGQRFGTTRILVGCHCGLHGRHWLPWLVVAGAVFAMPRQMCRTWRGGHAVLYEALYIVTVFQGSNIVTNSLSALIILQEMDGAPCWKLLGYIGSIVVMIGALAYLVSGEEAVSPSNDVDDNLRRMLSMEEGDSEDTESEDEPDLLGFVRALSLDQFSPSWFSSWSWNTENSEDGEDSQTGEEEQNEESDHANDSS